MTVQLDAIHSGPEPSPIDVLRVRARAQPEKRLFTFSSDDSNVVHEGLTYAGLDLKARALAVRLAEMGLVGERALLPFPPGLDFVVAFYGCLYAGVVAVPASPGRPNRPNDRLRAIVGDARPRAVLTSSALRPVPELEGLPRLAVDEVEEGLAGAWRDPGSGEGNLAFLQYTSGSTATPKGVMVTLGNLAHNSAVIADCFGTDRESHGVFWLPLHHDMGLIGGVLQTIHCGGSSTLFSPSSFLQRPLRWLELISETGAVISGGPNFAYDLCARKAATARVEGLDLARWRVAFNGAEPVRPETLDRFARAFEPSGFRREAFLPCYGMAETTLLVSGGPWPSPPPVLSVDASAFEGGEIEVVEEPGSKRDGMPRSLVGCGQVASGMEVVIADPESGGPLPDGRLGEIWVAGPSVASGYWGRAEETAQAFGARPAGSDAGPYLRTGDLGFLRDGELFVTGRIKDLIIIRGRNVYPQDIEWTAQQAHPALRPDAGAAFAVEVEGQERLVIVQEVERHAGRQADEAILAIRRAVADRWELEVHAVALIRPMSLPRTSSGKVRRHACREQFLAGTLELVAHSVLDLDESTATAPAPGPVAGKTSAEVRDWLAARLGGMLGTGASRVDSRREFASFGLGSLQAARLAGELEEWLGRPISPTLVYDYPTIDALANYLAGGPVAAPTDGIMVDRTMTMINGRSEPEAGSPIGHRPIGPGEPIAVIGIGCRFPGADGPEAFWRLLSEGVDAVGEWPDDRRGIRGPGRRGGFLPGVDRFDAEFFGIPDREAARMDPQQRLLLEVAWEALEDAGQVPERLAGSPVGVFVGISTNDYGLLQVGRGGAGDAHTLTGNAASIAANRISYAFDFHGPSLAVDSACSSSLAAIHLACGSLRSGEASLALAGGVNLALSPEVWDKFATAGFLAVDGRCKTFDARADGYARGEGAALVVLKPLSAARADGDPIYAVIRGGAINQDGRTNGLTAPSRWSQEAVLRAACRAAGVAPASLDYVEAHGTGTLLGDPIEAAALGAVVGEGRPADRPCVVGSVKTNIGHLEAAAGIAGLIKVALALEHRAIPPSLHFSEPNPHIPFDDLRLRVPRGLEPWPSLEGPPLTGVSSFGFGGSNAHIVLEGVDRPAAPSPEVEPAGTELIPLSARSPESLVELARSFREFLESSASPPLRDIAASAATRRGHHDHRIALLVGSKERAIDGLDAFLAGETSPGLWVGGRSALDRSPAVGAGADRLASLATRYVEGGEVDWKGVYPSGRFVKLPPHPWRRQRHWFEADETESIDGRPRSEPEATKPEAEEDWRAMPADLRRAWLVEFLRNKVAGAMNLLIEDVDPARPLDELDLDSLTAFEIKWAVDVGLRLSLPMTSFVAGMSVARLAEEISARDDGPAASVREGGRGSGLPTPSPLEDRPIVQEHRAERQPVDRRGIVPASSSQMRLWFLDQLEPGGAAYSITSAVRLLGEVDVAAMGRAFNEVGRRHEILRTTFDVVEGRPVQVVAGRLELPIPVTDLSSLPESWRDREVASRLAEEAARPFDLAAGPLVRAWLLRLGPLEHVVLFNLHHIVADGLSMAILIRELAALYDALARGLPSPLPPPPLQYSDFARWQAERLASEPLRAELDYWRAKLGGVPTLELPTDRPRSADPTRRAGFRRLTVPKSLSKQAAELGRVAGATPFMTLLAAFNVLLHRYTGQSDIAVGTPIAGRPRSEFGPMIGLFVNSLVLRTDLSGDPDFRELLGRTRRTAVEAYSHQEVPFDQIVSALQPDRGAGHSPLFQVMFAYQDDPLRELQTPGLTLVPMEIEAVAAKFDLTLFATETEKGLVLGLEYDADLFDPSTVDRMLVHYRSLLEVAVEGPGRPIASLPMLPAAERHQLIREWNATRVEHPGDVTAHRLFEQQAARTPGAIAVTSGDRSLTYRELDEQSNRLAHHLRGLGVGPEVIVGVCLARSPELVVGLLGVLKAGGAYVPLDPTYPADRLGYMVADSGATILLAHSDLEDKFAGHHARVVLADGGWAEAADAPSTALEGGAGVDNLAYVIYTSGSTGKPKGAMIVHRGLTNYLNWCINAYRPGEGKGAPVHSSISFDLTVTSLFAPLVSGGRADLLAEDLGVEALAEALRREGDYSLVKITPAHLQLLGQQLAPGEAAGRTRAFIVGGEQLTEEHLAFWRAHAPGTSVVNEYGPTETVVGCCVHRVDLADPRTTGAVPIGRPIANTRLYILDARMQPTPIGVPGELFIGGDGVARGYLGRPALTAERFVPDPFGPPGGRLYRSGDRARWRGEGLMEFLGRSDDQVKIRGYRVELGEVEAALAGLPEVREAAVVALGDGSGDRRLVGYVAAEAGRTIDAADLRRDLARSLPGYMVPSTIMVLEALPLTPNGKVDRAALPGPDSARGVDRRDEPTGPVEDTLCRIVAEVLKLDFVAPQENLFDLGIDSILVIQVVSKARAAGLRLQPGQLFRHQSVAELARVVEPFETIRVEQGPVVGPVPLTPIQRWFFERDIDEPEHYNQALLLEVAEGLDAEHIERAVAILAGHHDALRLRFARDEGGWSQRAAAPDDRAVAFEFIDISTFDDPDRRVALEAEAARLQASMILEDGPIFRAALFDLGLGRPSRLLLSIHHLAVDGVSWRIILEDLATILALLDRGLEPALPPKTTSVRQWAEALEREARSPSTAAELDYWLSEARVAVEPLPVDLGEGRDPGTEAGADVVSLDLDAEQTRALLLEVPRAFHSQINDALLASLAGALAGWSGGDSVRLDLEGHGREEIADGVDLSRTVGWFTTIFPVRLELPEGRAPEEMMRSIKEQLRRVPRRGIGYGLLRHSGDEATASALRTAPEPEVAFNYLGQLDQVLPAASGFARADESPGPTRAPGNRRSHLVDVLSFVAEGRFRFDWTYNPLVHRRETIEGVAAEFIRGLTALVAAARSPEVRGYVPSDFPMAGLDQATLDRAFAGERGIEDIYPLSPMQEGMLFDAAYSDGAGTYVQQMTCVLRGEFEAGAFAEAWRRVVERHAALRTSFPSVDADRPMQVVHRQVELPLVEIDWQGAPPEEHARRLDEHLKADRERGFVLSWAPLLRLALIRLEPGVARAVLTFHHAILDGWCMPILFTEVLTLYQAGRLDLEAALPPRRPYRDFIAWLRGQDPSKAEAYWREALRGFRAPTSLGIDRPGPIAPGDREDRGERIVRLPEGPTSALNGLARAEQVTLNTIVQGAWALLLARYSGQSDVVFGATVSGRQADLEGVESMIGLFINTLPTRVSVDEGALLVPWLKEIQSRQAAMREHEHTSLVDVHGWSEIARGRPLFESILVFENYPSDVGGLPVDLRFEPARVFEETNFPFTLMVAPGLELTLRVDYDAGRFEAGSIDRLLDHFRTLLEGMGADPARPLSDLPLIGLDEHARLLGLAGGNATDPAAVGLDFDLDASDERELDLLLLRLTGGGEPEP